MKTFVEWTKENDAPPWLSEQPKPLIKLVYRAIDGAVKKQTFTDIEKVRVWARHWVGEHPEIGSDYAVSSDGIATIRAYGISIEELFQITPEPEDDWQPPTSVD